MQVSSSFRPRTVGMALFILLVAFTFASGVRLALAYWSDRGERADLASASNPAAATDKLMRTLQGRIASGDGNPRTYALLGQLYLQKVRETGDPSYYGLSEAVFRKALDLDPRSVDALTGMGSLSMSRHLF